MDEFLSEREDGLSEIQKWIEDRMPEIVKDLTRICRIRSVAETEAVPYPPYGKGCLEVLEAVSYTHLSGLSERFGRQGSPRGNGQ